MKPIFYAAFGFVCGSVGFALGVLVETIRRDTKGREKISRSVKIFERPGYSGPWVFLGRHGEADPYPKSKRIWPPSHAGGAKTSEVYDWAAKWIVETRRDPQSNKSILEAWAEVPNEFPDYISKYGLEKKQWESFRKQVRRRLDKRT